MGGARSAAHLGHRGLANRGTADAVLDLAPRRFTMQGQEHSTHQRQARCASSPFRRSRPAPAHPQLITTIPRPLKAAKLCWLQEREILAMASRASAFAGLNHRKLRRLRSPQAAAAGAGALCTLRSCRAVPHTSSPLPAGRQRRARCRSTSTARRRERRQSSLLSTLSPLLVL